MTVISKLREKIRLPSRQIGSFDSIDNTTLEDFLVRFNENVERIVAPYAELDPMKVNIRTDVDEYYVRYEVYASVLETDEQFAHRMAEVALIEVEEARLVEEAKIIKTLACDSELGEYIRLREKFKLYEFDK